MFTRKLIRPFLAVALLFAIGSGIASAYDACNPCSEPVTVVRSDPCDPCDPCAQPRRGWRWFGWFRREPVRSNYYYTSPYSSGPYYSNAAYYR